MTRLVAALLLLLLPAACGTGIGWPPKLSPTSAATARDWTKPGADAAAVEQAYDECAEIANAATSTDNGIDQDIASTRGSDLGRSEFAQGQMQQSRDTTRGRTQTALTSCMTRKGFSLAR